MLDEAPLRATTVLLVGDYPTISCRSTFREHYSISALAPDMTLTAKVRNAFGLSPKAGGRKGRRESLGVAAAITDVPSVMDIGFSSVFLQVIYCYRSNDVTIAERLLNNSNRHWTRCIKG